MTYQVGPVGPVGPAGQRFLAALAPVVIADGVRRSGPIEQAFQGAN